MTDSMKFGPEWLRNLSEAPVQQHQPVRAQLAEFRYGREEMLALYSSNLTPPESLKNLPGLYIEKPQPPLALNTMTDEETRMWNRGINSEVPLRSGKGGEGRGALRGAGGSNRGRGRGGVGGGPTYYGRGGGGGGVEPGMAPRGPGGAYEEDPYVRPTRSFERSQSYLGSSGERRGGGDSWPERNGGEGRGVGGTRSTNDIMSWRKIGSRTSEEPEEWRTNTKWMPGRTNSGNWREDDSWDPVSHSKGNHHLPEWATEKNSEGGGTFDSSGAFRTSDAPADEEEKVSRLMSRKASGGFLSKSEPEGHRRSLPKSPSAERESRKLDGAESGREDRPPPDRAQTSESALKESKDSAERSESSHLPLSPSPAPPPSSTAQEASPKRVESKPPPISQPPPAVTSDFSQPPPQAPLVQQFQPPVTPAASHKLHRSPTAGPPPLSPNLDQPPPPILPSLHQPPPNLFSVPPPAVPDSHLDDPLLMSDDIAVDLVAKLMEDEENKDKQWFYRDPQGQVQGPFTCNEMAEWFESGYFTLHLLVRRACDPNYAPLGELIKVWGCIPFLPENHPYNKEMAAVSSQHLQENLILASQYQQYQRSILLRQQQIAAAARPQVHVGKPPQDWMETHQVPPPIVDQVLPPQYQPQQAPPTASGHLSANSNHLRALLAQMQAQTLQRTPQPKPGMPRTTEEISRSVTDLLRVLQAKSDAQSGPPVGSTGGLQGPPPSAAVMETIMNLHQQQAGGGTSPIQNLLRQMQQQQQAKMQQQSQPPGPPQSNAPVDSVWNTNNWNQWSHSAPKGIKTEQQVLEEQLRAEDDRKREEMRKQEEAMRKAQEAAEEEEKAKQEMMASMMVEENMREMRKAEDLARRHQEEEELRRKQEASRRAEVERQRKGEEKRKKDEEKRKKEEEKKERDRLRAEEEKKKKEAEEAKKRAAAPDVMAKVQRQQWAPPPASNTSILDIQRSEREQQQLLRGLIAQQQAMEAAQQPKQEQSTAGLQLKWTETPLRQQTQVESLDAIQAEQRLYLKQLEKEKAEREKEKQSHQNVNPGALGSWSQGLTWGGGLSGPAWQAPVNPVSNSSSAPNVPSGGFWDSVGALPQPPKPVQQPSSQQQKSAVSQQQNQAQQQNKESKNKSKRDEMAVMKLFSVNSSNDEFMQWCTQSLTKLQSGTVDIPTFVAFLRDIDSPDEVCEYIKLYLGDNAEASDFAQQFIDRRRHGGNHGHHGHQQSTSPTPAANQDFQQVKGKNKKGKKGRMQRVDSRILNFSTTSAADRINIGDREYPEFE